MCYKKSRTGIIRLVAVILFDVVLSCVALAINASTVPSVFKHIVSRNSGSSNFVSESGV